MYSKPEILAVSTLAKSHLLTIEGIELKFSNGEQRHYERCRSNRQPKGAALVVPLLDDDTIMLVREYAAGIDQYEITFPKGVVEAQEEWSEAANRELKEEIGYGAHQLDYLRTVATSPNYFASQLHIFVARHLYPERLVGDEPEPLQLLTWSLKDYAALLAHPEFVGAMNIAALLLAREFLNAL